MTTKAKTGRKRGHGEGSIYQRAGDGRWVGQITVPGAKPKYAYGKTRREVAAKLAAGLRDVQQGLPLPSGRQTLGQFMERWLEDSARPTVAPATYDSYRRMIARHIAPALGKVTLDKLSPQHIQRLQADMLAAGLSPRTVAYARAVVRRALGQAMKWSLLPRNVASLVDPPKQERHAARFLTADEARRLTEALSGDRLEPLILLTLVTGLRRGEVLSLRWCDLDLDAGTVSVEGQWQRWGGVWQWRPLKTDASRRTLAIPPFVVAALRVHKARQNEERLLMGASWRGEPFGLVFSTHEGTPLDGPNLTRQFGRRVQRAGIRPLPFHGLRHSAATLLLARGLTIGQIQKVLGHATGRLTSDLYSHHVREIADRAASEMESLFGTG